VTPRDLGTDPRFPEDVRELDRMLSSIHFEPRASLGPELQGRLRRGGEPAESSGRGVWQAVEIGLLTLAMCLAIYLLWATLLREAHGRQIDQCCWDLDGGGPGDDGVLVEADPDESVRRLTIYEDADGSGGFSQGDPIRFVRGREPVLQPQNLTLTTFHHCCLDYDGGGKADDGVLVLSVPPDRVVMASIYDTRMTGDSPAPPGAARPLLR
jgi:hypothetical protein